MSEEVKKGMREKAEQGQWPHVTRLTSAHPMKTR